MPDRLEGEFSPGEIAEHELTHEEPASGHVQLSEERKKPLTKKEREQRPPVPSEFVHPPKKPE